MSSKLIIPGLEYHSPAERVGELLAEEMAKNPSFYFFSPDETLSNKFGDVFEVAARAWNLPVKANDLPEGPDGRIVEMLSENALFAVMIGHLMNGERAMMGSYEAFYSIISSQILQQLKFIQQLKKTAWRRSLPAVNLLSTSTCWRQEHNGFTHQSPALISQLLALPSNLVNCIFPVDDMAAEAAFWFMLGSKNVVNLATFNKAPAPRYVDNGQARAMFEESGASLYEFASDDDPDFVFTAAGDIATREAIEAIRILRSDMPGIRLRFIGINALSYRAIGTTDNKLSRERFDALFTTDKPIIANFHGYPATLETILENYANASRLRVHGYYDEGSTTTPFEMLRVNAVSRYDLASDVARVLNRTKLVEKYQEVLRENHAHAVRYGEDLIK